MSILSYFRIEETRARARCIDIESEENINFKDIELNWSLNVKMINFTRLAATFSLAFLTM